METLTDGDRDPMNEDRCQNQEEDNGLNDRPQLSSFLWDVFERNLNVEDGRHADTAEESCKSAFAISLQRWHQTSLMKRGRGSVRDSETRKLGCLTSAVTQGGRRRAMIEMPSNIKRQV